MKETLKKIGLGILDFVEVGMPMVALTIIFASFIVNVISRYIINSPVNACYELCLGGLVWCLLLSAPYAVRTHTNVQFTLLYDRMSPAGQMVFRLVGNAFLIFCFGVMLYPCFDWVMFMHRKYTAVLHVRMDIMYFPFVVFNFLTLVHLIYDFVKDIYTTVLVLQGKAEFPKEGEAAEQSEEAAEGGV